MATSRARTGSCCPARQYTRLDVPGGSNTQALGINGRHEVVGTYRASNGLECNYKYSQGTYTHILNTCANLQDSYFVRGINNAGTLVGATWFYGPKTTGFVSGPGLFSNDLTFAGAYHTEVRGIDNSAVRRMVGHYRRPSGPTHGALWTGSAPGVTYDFSPGATMTEVTGINDSGQIVGSFTDHRGTRGFLHDARGDRVFTYPGADSTRVTGINNPDSRGRFNVVGYYDHGFVDWRVEWHGFIATVSPVVPPKPSLSSAR